jgi:hypothetical protein
VVLTPRRWRQVCGAIRVTTVAKEPGRRGEHEISRKTIAQGRPDCSGEPVVTTLVWFIYFPREAAGATGTRLSLRPLVFRGTCLAQLGRIAPRGYGVASPLLPLPALPRGEGWGEGLYPRIQCSESPPSPEIRTANFDLAPHPPSPEGGLRRTRERGEVT